MKVLRCVLTCFAEPHCAVGHATKQQPTWRISVATMHTMLLAVNEISLQWQRRSGRRVQREKERGTANFYCTNYKTGSRAEEEEESMA